MNFVEADGPGFESFRIAVLSEGSGVTFVVTEKEVFARLEGPRIKLIIGSALNLSPLARLLLPNQRVPLIAVPVFITGKEVLRFLFRVLVEERKIDYNYLKKGE